MAMNVKNYVCLTCFHVLINYCVKHFVINIRSSYVIKTTKVQGYFRCAVLLSCQCDNIHCVISHSI